MTDEAIILLLVRALLQRVGGDSGGHYDYDVEEALDAVSKAGIDIAKEKERAWDWSNIPSVAFQKKWGGP